MLITWHIFPVSLIFPNSDRTPLCFHGPTHPTETTLGVLFYSLSRLFQVAYFAKCLRTVEAVQWAPTARKCKKKKKKSFMKKGDSWANSGLPCGVLSVLFTPRGAMISVMKSSFPSTVFCVYIWLYFWLNGCRAWHRNLRLMIEEWTVDSEISKDDQKRIKCVYLAILFQIYIGVLST